MPALSSPDREARDYLRERFGVPAEALADLRFLARRDELWMTTAVPDPELAAIRPPGLRALRRLHGDLKPTSTLLRQLASHLERCVVALSPDELHLLLLGRPVPCALEEGFVALAFDGDILGCGRCARGELRCLLPTSQRKGLLEILERRP